MAPPLAQINPLNPSDSIFPETLGAAPHSKRLTGRKILVVGGGQRNVIDTNPPIGNGRAMSLLFAREGAAVVILDSNKEAADATVNQIRSEGGTAHPYVFDVRDAEGIKGAVDESKKLLGGLDGLALVVGTSPRATLAEMTVQLWDEVFVINLRSYMLFSQRALEVMSPGASVLMISSMASQRASANNPAYECSKAAILALVRAVAKAGEVKGIRANGIAPGWVDTPMGRDASRKAPDRAGQAPFGRQATGWEVGYLALFLMSHEASYLTGRTTLMDAGSQVGIAGRKRNDASTRAFAERAKM